MELSPEQKQAIAEFTQDFENATVGLVLANPNVAAITPQQYGLMLASALYAAMRAGERNASAVLGLPPSTATADFTAFINAASVHYADALLTASNQAAREMLDAIQIPQTVLDLVKVEQAEQLKRAGVVGS